VRQTSGRLVGRAAPWLGGLAVFGLSFASPLVPPMSVGDRPHRPSWTIVLIVLVAVGYGVATALVRRWPLPLFALGTVGWLAFSMWIGPAVASYVAGSSLGRRGAVRVYAAAAVCVVSPSCSTRSTATVARSRCSPCRYSSSSCHWSPDCG
jgi:hypothetical protein